MSRLRRAIFRLLILACGDARMDETEKAFLRRAMTSLGLDPDGLPKSGAS